MFTKKQHMDVWMDQQMNSRKTSRLRPCYLDSPWGPRAYFRDYLKNDQFMRVRLVETDSSGLQTHHGCRGRTRGRSIFRYVYTCMKVRESLLRQEADKKRLLSSSDRPRWFTSVSIVCRKDLSLMVNK